MEQTLFYFFIDQNPQNIVATTNLILTKQLFSFIAFTKFGRMFFLFGSTGNIKRHFAICRVKDG
jgi:hypothetical protein